MQERMEINEQLTVLITCLLVLGTQRCGRLFSAHKTFFRRFLLWQVGQTGTPLDCSAMNLQCKRREQVLIQPPGHLPASPVILGEFTESSPVWPFPVCVCNPSSGFSMERKIVKVHSVGSELLQKQTREHFFTVRLPSADSVLSSSMGTHRSPPSSSYLTCLLLPPPLSPLLGPNSYPQCPLPYWVASPSCLGFPISQNGAPTRHGVC